MSSRLEEVGKYLQHEEVGSGCFGKVYRGIDTENSTQVALKKVSYRTYNPAGRLLEKMGETEKKVLEKVKGNRKIVELLEIIHNDQQGVYWLVMEYCDLGDLGNYLVKHNPGLNSKIKIIKECTSGVSFLHSLKPPIVHREIKPGNILLKQEGNEVVAKISDVAVGQLYEFDAEMTLNIMKGPLWETSSYYWPPEFFSNCRNKKPEADNFSLGLLISVIIKFGVHGTDLIPVSGKFHNVLQNFQESIL